MILAPTLTLSAGSGAAIVRPTFSRDFAGEKTLNNGTGPAITFTRASNATYFDANGVLQTAANDVPRFDHNPANNNSLGLLIEEARTNSIRNSQAGGSTNGVIGSGGAAPTNWLIGAGLTSNGVSTEIIGSGTTSGFAYIDIKVSGTPTSSSSGTIRPELPANIVAVNGQTWTASAYLSVVGGSATNATVSIGARGNDNSVDVGAVASTTFTPTTDSLSSQRRSVTITLNDAAIIRVGPFIGIAYTSGNPIDLTLRIAAPQLEQGFFPTSYIPTTTAAATRSADSAVVTPISSFYNQAEGTYFAEGSFAGAASSVGFSNRIFLQVGADANNNPNDNRILLYNRGSGGEIGVAVITNTATIFANSVGSATPVGVVTKLAFACKTDDGIVAVDGTLGTSDTSVTLPASGTFYVGGRTTTTTGTTRNVHIRKIAYWPKRLTNTLLQQLTT